VLDGIKEKNINLSKKIYPIMSDDCPSFLEVGGYLFVLIISSGMLLYVLFYPSFALRSGPVGYLITLAFMVLTGYSGYKIYQSLFPACWL
jgi:hypothetical protein